MKIFPRFYTSFFVGGALLLVTALPALRAASVLRLDSRGYSINTSSQALWSDSSGNNNTAYQSFTSWQPTLMPDATPTGASALQHPNPSDANGATGLNLTTPLASAQFTSAPTFTAIVVAKSNPAISGAKAFFGGANGSPAFRINGVANNSSGQSMEGLDFSNLNVYGIATANAVVDPTKFHVFTLIVNSASNTVVMRVDGATVLSTSLNGSTFPNGISYIGAGYPGSQNFGGQIAAVSIYNEALSGAALQSAEATLAGDYLTPTPTVQFDSLDYSGLSTGIWLDSSGNGNNATQTNPAQRPSLLSKATPSAAASLLFPNASAPNTTGLSLTTALSSPQFTSAPRFTAIVVAKSNPANPGAKAFFGGNNGSPALRINGVANNSSGLQREGLDFSSLNTAYVATADSCIDPTMFHVFAMTVDSSQNNVTVRVDGKNVISSPLNGRTFPSGISSIGSGALGLASQGFDGQIAAVYLYDRVLSLWEIQAVETMLASGCVPQINGLYNGYLGTPPTLSQSAMKYFNHHLTVPSNLERIQAAGNLSGRTGTTPLPNPSRGWFDYAVSVPTSGWYEFLVNWNIPSGDYQKGGTGYFYPYTAFILDPSPTNTGITSGVYVNSQNIPLTSGQIKPGNVWLEAGVHTVRFQHYKNNSDFIPITSFTFNPLGPNFATNLRVAREEYGALVGDFYVSTGGTIPLTVQAGWNTGGTFTAQVCKKSDNSVLSSTSVVMGNSPGASLTTVLNIVAPSTEGAYYLKYQANGVDVSPSVNLQPMQFYTINTAPATPPPSSVINRTLLQTINCATTAPTYFGGTGGLSQVKNTGFGDYRESGNKGYASNMNAVDPSWFAYTLPASIEGQLYLLEVDYPDNASRSFVMEVRQSVQPYLKRGCAVQTGGNFALTNKMATQSIFFWSGGTEAPRVVFLNYQNGMGAAAAQIRLYSVSEPLPWLVNGTGAGRTFGHYFEESFSFLATYANGGVRKFGFFPETSYRIAIERWAQMLKYLGGDTMWVSVSIYNDILFPSRSYSLNSGQFNQEDYFQMILLVAKKYGLKVIADFHPRSDDSELATAFSETTSPNVNLAMDKDGNTYPNRAPGADINHTPIFNPIHPANQAWLTGMLTEFVTRYKTESAFLGVSLRQMVWQNPGLNNFHKIEYGYDAYTAGLFAQNGGPADPGNSGSDSASAQARYGSYTSAYSTQWQNFRVAQIRSLYNKLTTNLQQVKSDIQIYTGVAAGTFAGQTTFDATAGVQNISDVPGFKYVYAKHQYGDSRPDPVMWAANRAWLTDPAKLLEFSSSRSYMPWASYAEDGEMTVPNSQIGLDASQGNAYLSGHLTPSFRNNLERYALIMANGDATMIMNGGNSYFIDQPITREFILEYKQLPTSSFALAPGSLTTRNAVVRELKNGSSTSMFYAVNRTASNRLVTITFSANTNGTRPSTGAIWTTSSRKLTVTLLPFQMIVYSVSGTPSSITTVSTN